MQLNQQINDFIYNNKLIQYQMSFKSYAITKIVGNYALEQKIGKGAFSEVYSAYDIQNLQRVAIKVISSELIDKNQYVKNLIKNEKIALNLTKNSPYIIKLLDSLKTSKNYYFVYQLCEEGDLGKLIKKQGHLKQATAIEYIRQIVQGFKTLFKCNIIHRDLKPQNILIKNGKLKIADFGMCKILDHSQQIMSSMIGTLQYQSPQIVFGDSYTNKCDIYSLGVLFYKMLFGVYPYKSKCQISMITQLHQQQLKIPKEVQISKKTQHILRRMLQKDQQKRSSWQQILNYFEHNKEHNIEQKQTNQNLLLNVEQYKMENTEAENTLKNKSRCETQATETTNNMLQNFSNFTTFSQKQQSQSKKLMIQQLLNNHQKVLSITELAIQMIKQNQIFYRSQKLLEYFLKDIRQKYQDLIQQIKKHKSQEFTQIGRLINQNSELLQNLIKNCSFQCKLNKNSPHNKSQINKQVCSLIAKILKRQNRIEMILGIRIVQFYNNQRMNSIEFYQNLNQEQLANKLYKFLQ